MSSMVLYSKAGVVAEWHKDGLPTVRKDDDKPRRYATPEAAVAAAKRKAAKVGSL